MLPLLFTLLTSPAHAGDWSDFAEAFPTLPCSDGWAGCIVGEQTISAEPVKSSDGVPVPADQRLSWFSLDSQPAFDPFGGLSVYTGAPSQPATTAALEPDKAEIAEPPPQVIARNEVPADPPPEIGTEEIRGLPVAQPPAPAPVEEERTMHLRVEEAPETPSLPANPTQMAQCGDTNTLAGKAMSGKLDAEAAACLDVVATTSPRLTERGKANRALIWQAKGTDKKAWARLVKRHLDEIERSDPDMAMTYALHLARSRGDASAIIKWSDVALDNRHLWTGDAYKRKTERLRSLKAIAAATRWQALEKANASGGGVDPAELQKWRRQTVTLSREWNEYAASVGGNTDKAMALCISAAGTEDACR